MNRDIVTLLYDMARQSPKSIKSISEEVGKPYSTLMRELDPADKGAKLGVELLLPLMQSCDSIAPLRYLADRMGYRVVANRDIIPDKTTLHEELLDTYQALVDYHRSMLERQPLEVVSDYREHLIRQLKEDFVAFMSSRRQEMSEAVQEEAALKTA
ncbi:hypothetical protein NNJEOMEG_04024 [Fundidesulfovibrio magnetotacticus]|uniref:Uncharacterized protein n=1 Tax=Fundidesulfovibrio magnetotacticus TaxID=2730080 RepID=A0A6V8LWM6_9BACT|nr:phage regulatory CII family protein [Fundidesulfovibrio magnetotacticus]GFK96144.1 hypothetical protein NNJEOMEG_04024 [Fundidesulfovibrio magnetotacticus]